MADGSLGKLFFELGVKDNVSTDLNRVLKAIQNTDGSISKLRSSLAEYQKTLSGDAADEFARGLGKSIKTALDYLNMLQRIERESNKIASLKQLNPGIKTQELETAEAQLKRIKNDLLDLQKGKAFGGVDGADLAPYQKALRNTISDVKNLESAFNKDNSLSAAKNNAARLNNELETVKRKLEEIRSLQSEGMRYHIPTTPLLSGGNTLRGVKTRIEKILADDSLLANETKVKSLLSDISYALNKATTSLQEYGLAKKKVFEENSIENGLNRQKKAINDANILLENLSRLEGKNVFGVDTSKLSQAKTDISDIISKIQSLSGVKLTGQEFKNLISEFGIIKTNAQDAMKEVSQSIRKAAADTNEAINSNRRYEEILSQIQRKAIELNNISKESNRLGTTTTGFDNSIKNMTALVLLAEQASTQEKNSARYVAELSSEYRKLCNNIADTVSEQKKLNTEAKRLNSSNTRQAEREINNISNRIVSLSNVLDKLNGVRKDSLSLGLDTRRIDNEIYSITTSIKELEHILNRLKGGDMSALGLYKNIGTGRDVQASNSVAREMSEANKEARRGIEIEKKRQKEIANSASKVRGELVKAFEQANNHAGKLNSTLQDIKSLFLQGGIVFGAQQFAMSIITTGGEMEKQHIALQSILGDIQNANTLFGQVKELALNSPFTFSELNRDVKQLAAYGVEYDQLYDTTKRLADMSSGLGVSFDRIALAFGQVRSRGWLDGKELRQISYAGIPLLGKLSEFYSKQEGRKVTTSEVKTRISKRDVSFEDVKNIFWQMTDAGGQFYNMQQTLSETLLGRYNKLKDAWEIMLSDFASGKSIVGGTFIFIIDLVTKLVQSLHTLGPVVAAAFSGFALTKFTRAFGGNAGATFLANKAKISDDIMRKRISGAKINQYEKDNFITNRGRITDADLKTLVRSGQLNKLSTQRLFIEGKITTEQYKQTIEMIKQRGALTGLNTQAGIYSLSWRKVGLSIKLAGLGLVNVGRSVLSMMGGLPGMILTGVTMAIAYFWNKNEELKRAMSQTMEELEDRKKSLKEFFGENNITDALKSGDEKEISNLIDTYKKKLQELVPEKKNAFEMSLHEKSSNEERLKYLEKQLKLTRDIVNETENKLSDEDVYSDFNDAFKGAKDIAKEYTTAEAKASTYSATNNDFDKLAEWRVKYKSQVEEIKNMIIKELGDGIYSDPKLQGVANQIMSSMFSKNGWDQDVSDQFRADVLNSLGIGTSFYEDKFKESFSRLINESYPWIADKIRNNKELTEAENEQVKNMMKNAADEIRVRYPEAANVLKNLLAQDNFMAVIHLVFDTPDDTPLSKELGRNIQGSGSDYHKKQNIQAKWKKGETDISKIESNAKSSVDSAYQNYKAASRMLKKGKISLDEFNKIQEEYNLEKETFTETFGNAYNGKEKGQRNGRKEDAALKAWQERLSSYKSARQMYQKYKTLPGWGDKKAKNYVEELYDNISGLDLNNYEKAIEKLQKELVFNTPERRKALTSLKRELGEWRFSDVFKPELDRIAADFTESLNKGAKQFDLYKSILEKTGNKDFASRAFVDGSIWDDQARSLAQQFNELTKGNKILDVDATEATAKKYLEDVNGAYDLWKQIADLVHGNYRESLTSSADLIKEALDYEERIVAAREKYNKLIENANKVGNKRAAVVARQQIEKEIGKINLDKFKNSSDYLNFYGAIVSLGEKKARSIAEQIRRNINEALQSGAIDAREYAKELKQLEEQLDKLSEVQPSFFHGGLNGIVSSKKNKGNDLFTQGSSQYNESQKLFEVFQQRGDLGGMAKASQAKVAGQSMMDGGETLMRGASEMQGSIAIIDTIIHGINDIVQGLNDTFQDIKGTSEALGADTESDGWTDANSFFSGFASASASATKGWDSLKNGDIGGVISGVVGSFTGWIKAFAAGHDAKLDRQIKLAERQLTELKNISSNIGSVIEKTLGGVYTYSRSKDTSDKLKDIRENYLYSKNPFTGKSMSRYSEDTYNAVVATDANYSAYADQLALLNAQRDELQKQRNLENDKKKKDKDKLADYDQQLKEMELNIKTFAQDFLKDIYSIDMKSWASQLTDAIVGAWEKGENAAEAYRKKVKDLVKDVTKNIVSQKIMELALQKPLDFLTDTLSKKGKLDEGDMLSLADMLMESGEGAVSQITGIYDYLKRKGLDLKDSAGSSSSNTTKGITEETADIIAAYLNSIRLDVSVNREYIKAIADYIAYLPQLNAIAQSQLSSMNQLVSLAEYRNGKLDDMYSWMRSVTSDTGNKKIRVN